MHRNGGRAEGEAQVIGYLRLSRRHAGLRVNFDVTVLQNGEVHA